MPYSFLNGIFPQEQSLSILFFPFKERRIYDLKKKNQELEKYKFVLSYKIDELKKQIEPRETDIKNYKEQIQEVNEGTLMSKNDRVVGQ